MASLEAFVWQFLGIAGGNRKAGCRQVGFLRTLQSSVHPDQGRLAHSFFGYLSTATIGSGSKLLCRLTSGGDSSVYGEAGCSILHPGF
jgi:hypothetical protein